MSGNQRISNDSFEDEDPPEYNGLCYNFKSRLIQCCSFTYQNNSQLLAVVCFVLLFIFGILKVIFGIISVTNGRAAIFLVQQERLLWAGLFLLLVGFSSMLFGIISTRSISCKLWTSVTAKPFFVLIFGMFYLVLFDIIAVIMASDFNSDDFALSLQANMDKTLTDKYGVSSSEFREHWDDLQRSFECCGSSSYEQWFISVWADEITTSLNFTSSLLPLSCLYQSPPSGPCNALMIQSPSLHASYLVATNHTHVAYCQVLATTAYAYVLPCAPMYIDSLVEEMQSLMRIGLGLMATDVTITIALTSIAFKLPFQHRINVYDAQFET